MSTTPSFKRPYLVVEPIFERVALQCTKSDEASCGYDSDETDFQSLCAPVGNHRS
ncbi:MAG: hypothetical protein R6V58_06555 [Planctomycetota bacterium]